MQHTLSRHTLSQLCIMGLVSVLAFTGCNKKTESADNAAAASVAESQAAPMSAAPADEKNAPIVNADNANVDAGPDAGNTASATANVDMMPASGAEVEATGEGEADNSAMDKITENDKVIDNEPASPNAPKAIENEAPAVANQKVGQ